LIALIRNFTAVTGLAFAAETAAQVSFFEDESVRGQCFSTQQPNADFSGDGLSDSAFSADVTTKHWDRCEISHFDEHGVVFYQGRYSSQATLDRDDGVPTLPTGYIEHSVKVSSTCLVAVARNRYSVPCALAGQRVSTRLYPNRVVITIDETIVASYVRLTNRGNISYDWQHYILLEQRQPGAFGNTVLFADIFATFLRLRQKLYALTNFSPAPIEDTK
jgi:hypothetical protein